MRARYTELRDVIDEILRKMDWTQEELAKKLGTTQSNVSKMRYGPDWQLHWEVLWKIIAICDENEIDPSRSRHNSGSKGVIKTA
jgi:DNA-binding Xre family transcriptional regulator